MEPADLRAVAQGEPRPGALLVAAPMLVDPNFARTLVLLLDVEPDGVLGVVLNRPSDIEVGDVLEPWAPTVGQPGVLFRGGPVGTDSALAVARLAESGPTSGTTPEPVGWRPLFERTGLVDLDAPIETVAPALTSLRIYAGYAGWSGGQLEAEIDEGAWYVVPGRAEDGFDADPVALWQRVLRRQAWPLTWLATYPEDPTRN